MHKRLFNKWGFAALLLMCLLLLVPISRAYAVQEEFPTYPNLESFSIENSEFSVYLTDHAGNITPSYFFPELQGYKTTTLHDNTPMTMTSGSFTLSGETGPDGNVTGSYQWSGYGEKQWESGDVDLYEVTAKGQITNAKAAYDNYGLLRIMGAAHYERKFEFSGPVTITLKYSTLVWDENVEDQVRIEGTVSAQAQFAFVSCISNEEQINECWFEAGKGYGDYGFDGSFTSNASKDFVWFNNLDFEFQLIEGINFDPEAHHKLTQQPEEEDEQPEEMVFDESYLDKPLKAEKVADDPNAGFNALVSCDSPILPEDGITCNLNITGGTENQPYSVNWILDGYVIKSGTVLLNADRFIFPNPPPGDHPVEVQVMDQATYALRVTSTLVEVAMPEDAGKIKPWTQAMMGAGSVAILGAWLWSEWAAAKSQQDWFEKFFEDWNQKDRDEWYEEQMDYNKKYKAYLQAKKEYEQKLQAKIEKHNALCEKEAKRFVAELKKVIAKNKGSEHLIDLYNDLVKKDAFRNGIWDAKQLLRAEEVISILLTREQENEWKRQMDFLNKRQKAFTDLTYSWTAGGVEVLAALVTGGASELIFIPTRAIGNAIYAAKRAALLKKTGWDAAKHVMIEAGLRLGIEALFIEGAQIVVPKLLSAVGWAGKKIGKAIFGPEKIERAGMWLAKTYEKYLAPKGNNKLPVIENNWGKGPKVFVNQPSGSWVNPKPIPRVDFGMDNFLNNRIRPVSSQLADDMGHLFREGININPNVNNLLKMTDKIALSQSDDIALKLINNKAYKQAVADGLVPTSVQQAVYQARDKLCKRAIQETFKELDGILIGGKTASSYIESVAITGTGAKPLSPQAIGRFTDFDSTVIAGDSALAKKAEKLFADTFHKKIAPRIDAKVAQVKMFPGFRTGTIGSHSGGYISKPMMHWTKVDAINRGRSVVRLEDGTLMFDAHPDVAPMKNFGPMDAIRFPADSSMAIPDAHSVVTNDVAKAIREYGRALTQEEILIQHGKQAVRAWKAINAGSGRPMPLEFSRYLQLKNNPGTRLTAEETSRLWRHFTEFLDLPTNLGVRG